MNSIGISSAGRVSLGASAVLLLLMLIGTDQSAHAWEQDVHQGLTEFLARKAGFRTKYAKKVGNAAQAYDEGKLDPVTLGKWYACRFYDEGGSDLLQTRHFYSSRRTPNLPGNRQVYAGTGNRSSAPVRKFMDPFTRTRQVRLEANQGQDENEEITDETRLCRHLLEP